VYGSLGRLSIGRSRAASRSSGWLARCWAAGIVGGGGSLFTSAKAAGGASTGGGAAGPGATSAEGAGAAVTASITTVPVDTGARIGGGGGTLLRSRCAGAADGKLTACMEGVVGLRVVGGGGGCGRGPASAIGGTGDSGFGRTLSTPALESVGVGASTVPLGIGCPVSV